MAVKIKLLCHAQNHGIFAVDQGLGGQPVAQTNLLTAGHLGKREATKSPTSREWSLKLCTGSELAHCCIISTTFPERSAVLAKC